jgi:chromosome segregation ATPase
MKQIKYITVYTIAVLALTGCVRIVDDPIPVEHRMAPAGEPRMVLEQDDREMAGRYTDPGRDARGGVENALQWSKKYEQLSMKAEKLREENTQLKLENNDLKIKLAKTQEELDRTNKELAEANEFLQELQLELTEWKSDVLGFRHEIRDAQAAQLEALAKILKLLGAEPTDQAQQ